MTKAEQIRQIEDTLEALRATRHDLVIRTSSLTDQITKLLEVKTALMEES